MNLFKTIARPVLFVVAGLCLGGLAAAMAGENPFVVFLIMIKGVVGSQYDLGMTLYYGSILLLSGLAVALPYKAGLFNIGGEGQMLVGAFVVAIVGILFGNAIPSLLSGLVGVLAAFAGGAVWSAVAAWIRAYRGGHEVISSIMLNFIAAGLTSWLTLEFFRAADSQNPETHELADVWMWAKFETYGGAPVTWLVGLSVLIALGLAFYLAKSKAGYSIKATAAAFDAARISGINTLQVRFWSMCLGGGFSGLAGGMMVLASSSRFHLEMAEGFGFMGIPVALLAKGEPVGLIFSALLFAALHHGASALDLEATRVTRDLSQVIQALVVIAVVSERLFRKDLWTGLVRSIRGEKHGNA